jgi:hypothetical protein
VHEIKLGGNGGSNEAAAPDDTPEKRTIWNQLGF